MFVASPPPYFGFGGVCHGASPWVGCIRDSECDLCWPAPVYIDGSVYVCVCRHSAVCRSCLVRHLADVKQCPQCSLLIDHSRLSKEIRSVSSGWCRLGTFSLRFDSHHGSFASNLEQVANLLCAEVNSASYPQRDGKLSSSLRATGWMPSVVCLLAANRGSNCSLTRAMDGRRVRCGVISSCQSAATSEAVKRFCSRTHVRSAVTSIATFPLPLVSSGSRVSCSISTPIYSACLEYLSFSVMMALVGRQVCPIGQSASHSLLQQSLKRFLMEHLGLA